MKYNILTTKTTKTTNPTSPQLLPIPCYLLSHCLVYLPLLSLLSLHGYNLPNTPSQPGPAQHIPHYPLMQCTWPTLRLQPEQFICSSRVLGELKRPAHEQITGVLVVRRMLSSPVVVKVVQLVQFNRLEIPIELSGFKIRSTFEIRSNLLMFLF